MKETVVILTEKPLDTAKLKASFKKNGNDDDFFPNADHIKLVFAENDKGKLTQLAIQSGGGAVIRQGDKNIRAEATVKDGSVQGTAGTVKADKVRDKLFEFDVVSGKTKELLSPESLLKGADENLTPEEKARRERQRVSVGGFADFHLNPSGSHVLVKLSNALFVLDRGTSKATE